MGNCELPWGEKLNMLSVNPDAATNADIARMATELSGQEQKCNTSNGVTIDALAAPHTAQINTALVCLERIAHATEARASAPMLTDQAYKVTELAEKYTESHTELSEEARASIRVFAQHCKERLLAQVPKPPYEIEY